MSRVYLETEHQELFLPDAELRAPLHLHVPSALGALGYYVCLRLPAAMADALGETTLRLQVAGLRPDDVSHAAGDGLGETADRYPSTDGMVWRLLARAKVSRGDGVLTFAGLPAGLARADVLLCTWPRFIASGEADQWLACQGDPAFAPGGVPLGGIGTGKVEICRDGRFRNFSGNNNQDMPFEEPDGLDGAYLTVGLPNNERVLATRPVRGRAVTYEPVPDLQADLTFPRATLTAIDAIPGVDVTVTLSGPTVPQDLATSALPGFLVRWRITNRMGHWGQLRLRLAWPNLVGRGGGIGEAETRIGYADGHYRYWDAPEEQTACVVSGDGWRALRYGNAPSPVSAAADGHHWLAARGAAGAVSFHNDGARGSLVYELSLNSGATETVDMLVLWEMPHYIDADGADRGLYWQRDAADGQALVERMFSQYEAILAGAGALHELVRGTDLPAWLGDRLQNCCYPLVTNSVLYRDGRFSINEGPTEMAGCYGTIDQRLGAHAATQLLYPELNATELGLFRAYQDADGGVNHDLGHGHLERGVHAMKWPDLTCSFVLQHARHAWSTGDRAWADRVWPACRLAVLKHAAWAEAGGGVAQVGKGLGTSYDGYHYEGTTPYMATLWLATIKVARRWATAEGDTELLPRLDAWEAAALARLEADLWNGRFYKAYGAPDGRQNENCHAGMLAGQYYATLLAGEDVLPADRLASCADAWFALNGNDAYQIPPDEVAPDGSAGSEYGWLPYVESFGLAALATLRDSRVLPVFKRMVGHMSGHGARPCDTRLMYQPLSGEISWGSYYMTAPASWLVYDALTGFACEPSAGLLRLAPQFDGRFPLLHPRFWAVVDRQPTASGYSVSLTISRCFGEPVTIHRLELPQDLGSCITVDERSVAASGSRGGFSQFALPATELGVGAAIRWEQATV